MDYRKKAPPVAKKDLPQETMEEWQVAKGKIEDDSKKTSVETKNKKAHRRSASSGSKKVEEETRVELQDLLKAEELSPQSVASRKKHPDADSAEVDAKRNESANVESRNLVEENNLDGVPRDLASGTSTPVKTSKMSLKSKSSSKKSDSSKKQKSITSIGGAERTMGSKSTLPAFLQDKMEETVEPTNVEVEIPITPNKAGLHGEEGFEVPVQHIKFDPNDGERSIADVSLPPELVKEKKIKIWQEEADRIADREQERRERRRERRRAYRAKCFLCGDDELEILAVTSQDSDTVFEEEANEARKRLRDRSSFLRGSPNVSTLTCGVDPHQLLDDAMEEVKDSIEDIKEGVKSSMRSLFGACDITKDGGVDILTGQVQTTGDQLLGKKPYKTTVAAAPSQDSETNPQVEKMTSILRGDQPDEPIKREFGEGPKRKKFNHLSPIEKQNLYRRKLKELSLKHL
ncbi:hypothetical protein ACHAWF_005337 [Thalassiosira exigua]